MGLWRGEEEADERSGQGRPQQAVQQPGAGPRPRAVLRALGARARSARARTMTCHLDLRYGEQPGETIDLFPARKGDGSCMMFIHGGYWRSLDKKDFSFLAPTCVDGGISLAVVNYDLCPKVSMEEIVRQMLRASRWLWLHAEEYGMDQDRLYVERTFGRRPPHRDADVRAVAGVRPRAAEGPVEGRPRHQRRLRPAADASSVDWLNVDLRLDDATALRALARLHAARDARAGDDAASAAPSRASSCGRTRCSASAGRAPSPATCRCRARTISP